MADESKPEYTPEDEEAKCKEIRDRFDEAFTFWDRIYKDGQLNLKAIAGDPWKAEDRQAREDAGRPVVTFDELGQYVNHAINDVRANPVAVKFSPTDEVASDQTAKFYGGRMRETEYRSNAQMGYTTAFENALQFNSGYVRIKTEYEHPRSFNQQMAIEPIPNPASVYPDPDGLIKPDGSAWKYLFNVESYTKDEFKRTFGKTAKYVDFSKEQLAAAPKWIGSDGRVQVAEYWEVESEERELVEVQRPDGRIVSYIEGLEDAPMAGRGKRLKVIQRRPTTVDKVCSYFTNGIELLEKNGRKKHPWAGRYIPFASCYGKIVYLNNGSGPEPRILALTTLAREPFMAYCFAAACELEAVGTITKNPYFAYEGQLTPAQKTMIKRSLHEPVAVLEAKAKLEGLPGVLIPLPQRNPMSIDLSAYALVKEGARRAIQAAMGLSPLPTSMQRTDPKLSGKAMDRFEESGQRGSYHFKDGYYNMIRRIGVIFEDLEDKIEDTERLVNVRAADNTSSKVYINSKQQKLPNGVEALESNKGIHAVTVDIGPEFASERRESAAFLDTFVTSPTMQALEPAKQQKLIALAIRERVLGPMGEKMAEVISPPEPGDQPDPEQLRALLQQAQEQIIPALQQQIQALQAEKAAKVTETEGKLVVQAAADETKMAIAKLQTDQKATDTDVDSDTALAIAKLQADIDVLKMQLDAKIEGAKLAQSTEMAERGIESGRDESARDRAAAVAEGDKQREAAAREGDENRKVAKAKPKAGDK